MRTLGEGAPCTSLSDAGVYLVRRSESIDEEFYPNRCMSKPLRSRGGVSTNPTWVGTLLDSGA